MTTNTSAADSGHNRGLIEVLNEIAKRVAHPGHLVRLTQPPIVEHMRDPCTFAEQFRYRGYGITIVIERKL